MVRQLEAHEIFDDWTISCPLLWGQLRPLNDTVRTTEEIIFGTVVRLPSAGLSTRAAGVSSCRAGR